MRARVLLAGILVGVGLCLVPAVGYGEVSHDLDDRQATQMDISLLKSRISYMMTNFPTHLFVYFEYDSSGWRTEKFFPRHVDTKDKVFVLIMDTFGDTFSDKSGTALLGTFRKELERIYLFLKNVSTDMDTDIVARFLSKEGIPLGYFYQGEYHLWEEW